MTQVPLGPVEGNILAGMVFVLYPSWMSLSRARAMWRFRKIERVFSDPLARSTLGLLLPDYLLKHVYLGIPIPSPML